MYAKEQTMIHKQLSPIAGCVRVRFELPSCIWADRICVVGDFNDWDRCANPLKQERDGVWRAVVDLPTGKRYAFRYLIDGNWQTDTNADGFIASQPGLESSIVDTSIYEPIFRLNEVRRVPAQTAVAIPA